MDEVKRLREENEHLRKQLDELTSSSAGTDQLSPPLPLTESAFLEKLPIGVYRTNRDGDFLYANERLATIFEVESAEVMMREVNAVEIYPSLSARQEFHDILAKERQWNGQELEMQTIHGRSIWIRNTSQPVFDEDGHILYVDGYLEDITEAHQSAQEIATSQKRYRQLVENFPNGAVYLFDEDLRFHVAGGEGLARKGWTSQALIGKTLYEIVPAELAQQLAPNFLRALAGEEYSFQTRFRDRFHKAYVLPVATDYNCPKMGMMMTQDITEQHNSESRLRQAESDLRSLIDASLNTAVMIDLDGTILAINEAAARIYSAPVQSCLGKSCYAFLPPEVAEDRRQRTAEVIRTKKPLLYESEQAGSTLEVTVFPIFNEFGDVHRVAIFGLDVSQQRRNEIEMKAARAKAEAASRAKSEFLSIVSHEIRTPMNAVLGFSELLTFADCDTERDKIITQIRQSASGLLGIIDNILDYVDLSSSPKELVTKTIHLADLLDRASARAASEAEEKGINFNIEIDSMAPAKVVLCGDRFIRIIDHILDNSIKFTSNGHIHVGLEAEHCGPANQWLLRLRVRDTGIGIPVNNMDHIFDYFSQADSSDTRKYGGIGLGLALCKQMIDLMGGTISVDSIEGLGTTVEVTLPAGIA